MLTMERIKEIHAAHDVDLSEADFSITLAQCNEQAGMNGRSADDWAAFFARQEADTQRADEAALRQFHRDAYGDN